MLRCLLLALRGHWLYQGTHRAIEIRRQSGEQPSTSTARRRGWTALPSTWIKRSSTCTWRSQAGAALPYLRYGLDLHIDHLLTLAGNDGPVALKLDRMN